MAVYPVFFDSFLLSGEMPVPRKFFTLAIACLAFAVNAMAIDYPPVNPINQPLVVARAVNADAMSAVLDTRQAKALELDQKDYSGNIPGVDVSIDSLKAFIAAMGYGKAENLWYCLSQVGSSLANQSGAIGWDAADTQPNAPAAQVTRWLEGLGLDAHGRDVEIRPLDGSHARIIISRDTDTRNEILGGTGGPDNGWRGNLSRFLGDKNGGFGVWANTRPLLGLLTLLTGIDFRAKMNAHNMGVPVSAQINMYNNMGDLGFDAHLQNILPDEWTKTSTQPLIVQTRPDATFDLNFPTPAGIWDVLDLDKDVFFLANIDILPLIPRSMNVTAWRGDDGEMHWSVVCLMGNKEKFNQQLRRLQSWLQVISALSSETFSLSTNQSRWGDELWNIRVGSDALVMGVVDVEAAGKDNAFLVLSGSSPDWPNPYEIQVRPAANGSIIYWNVNLDRQSRDELVNGLAELSRERGALDFDVSFFNRFLPFTDTGWIAMEDKSLNIVSTHGLMPVLVPGIGEMLKRTIAPEAYGTRKVASVGAVADF